MYVCVCMQVCEGCVYALVHVCVCMWEAGHSKDNFLEEQHLTYDLNLQLIFLFFNFSFLLLSNCFAMNNNQAGDDE